MFIDFEGIDGSGKTTLSNRLASRLEKLGYRVAHAREGGELQSPTARKVRELTRDSQLLEMAPQAEFFLNVARDAQQLDEVIKPALRRGEICISDRYLYSQVALSHGGRGLPRESLQPALETAAQGIWPDLVVLVDVQPELARLRKRLGKLGAEKGLSSDSRKGLAGAGLAVRMRECFLAQARKDPARWIIIENNDQPIWQVEQCIVDAVLARIEGRPLCTQRPVPPASAGFCSARDGSVEERFFAMLEELELREPMLAAYLLAGLPGLRAHQRRLEFAERFPGVVARGLSGLFDAESLALRHILKQKEPAAVVSSLGSYPSDEAMSLRAELFTLAPKEVVESLRSNDSPKAWALRDEALGTPKLLPHVLLGLSGLDTAAAWELRKQGVRAGWHAAVARSLGQLRSAQADSLRETLFASDRLSVLRSLNGVDSSLARRVRELLFEKAPKLVLRSLSRVEADYAWEMREKMAPTTKEALDSVDGMDAAGAWSLRERYASLWPSTAISSLKELGSTPRGQALIARVLAEVPPSVALLRNAYDVSTRAPRTTETGPSTTSAGASEPVATAP